MSDLEFPLSPTRSEATERHLWAYAESVGISPDQVRPILFVRWLIEQKPSWKLSTWWQYKAAVAYLLNAHHPEDAEALRLLISTLQMGNWRYLPFDWAPLGITPLSE